MFFLAENHVSDRPSDSTTTASIFAIKVTKMPLKRLTALSVALFTTVALSAGPSIARTPNAAGAASPNQIDAAALIKDFGSAERIQRSGSLRMLSQRISATICNRVAGVKTADAEKYLQRSIRDYRRILNGLENGDDGLGLYGPEKNRVVLRDLEKLKGLWEPIDGIFQAFETDTLTRDHVVEVASTAPLMLEASKELLGFVVAEYSDPTQMLQSDAVLLQIAERQRMLEQIVANATCLIGNGIAVEDAKARLKEAIPQYEISLSALQTGLPEAGVAAPPTKAIELWLVDISDRWGAVRPTLDAIVANGDVTAEDSSLVFEEMNKLTWMMNVTVGQYTEASKLNF